MSMAMQVKLLRVLQEREIMRVGGNQIINVNVRMWRPQMRAWRSGWRRKFRRDLYYRLSTLPVLIPPLREREGGHTAAFGAFPQMCRRRIFTVY